MQSRTYAISPGTEVLAGSPHRESTRSRREGLAGRSRQGLPAIQVDPTTFKAKHLNAGARHHAPRGPTHQAAEREVIARRQSAAASPARERAPASMNAIVELRRHRRPRPARADAPLRHAGAGRRHRLAGPVVPSRRVASGRRLTPARDCTHPNRASPPRPAPHARGEFTTAVTSGPRAQSWATLERATVCCR